MSTTLTLTSPGTLQFAYIIGAADPGTMLRFLIDGTVAGTYGDTPAWTVASLALPAGTHKLTWNLLQGTPAADSPDFASIDDIVFPPGTVLLGTDSDPRLPAVATLGPSQPNPVTTAATISFTLPRAGHAQIALYDVLGREVSRLADDDFAAGPHVVRLDATGVRPGIYSLRFRTEGSDITRRLVVVH
jgi:hypothetical protein